MARPRHQQAVLPSLLDRLIDDEPDQRLEAVRPAGAELRALKDGLRRDLENLLNTRRYRQQSLTPYPELQRSVVSYGLPDFSTVLLGSAEHREHFRQTVQATIERFETRLRGVGVEIAQVGEEHERTLYLKITALLMIEPDPVPLLFDSRIRALDRVVTLRELRHG